MLNIKQLSLILTLTVTLLGSTSFGQQDDKTLFQECLQAQDQEFLPLTQERDALFQQFSSRATSVRRILTWLEEDYRTADAKRKTEIELLESRLKTLKENAKLTSPEATKNVATSIETANAMIADIEKQQDAAIKPFSRKLFALKREHKAQELTLEPIMMSLFRDRGDSQTTSALRKRYGSFSYSAGNSSATYKLEGKEKSAVICYIYLSNEKVGKQEYGLFNNKYPIAYRGSNQLEIIVGRTLITIYASDRRWAGKQLNATLSSLIDIEKLEMMLAR